MMKSSKHITKWGIAACTTLAFTLLTMVLFAFLFGCSPFMFHFTRLLLLLALASSIVMLLSNTVLAAVRHSQAIKQGFDIPNINNNNNNKLYIQEEDKMEEEEEEEEEEDKKEKEEEERAKEKSMMKMVYHCPSGTNDSKCNEVIKKFLSQFIYLQGSVTTAAALLFIILIYTFSVDLRVLLMESEEDEENANGFLGMGSVQTSRRRSLNPDDFAALIAPNAIQLNLWVTQAAPTIAKSPDSNVQASPKMRRTIGKDFVKSPQVPSASRSLVP